MARRDAPMSVEIPEPGADRPLWGKVGLVAAAGFVIGVAWPRLTSTRIAPSPPADNVSAPEPTPNASSAASSLVNTRAAAVSSKSAKGGFAVDNVATATAPPKVAPTSLAATAAAAPSEAVTASQNTPNAAPRAAANGHEPMVGTGYVLRCRDDQQDVADCGAFQFDGVAVPRIKALARCPAAKGASGKLSLGFDLDFRAKSVHLLLGKSTNLPRDMADALVHCAEPAFEPGTLAGLAHDHHQYTVFYSARFGEGAPTQAAAEKPPVANPAPAMDNGSAFIAWDVALLRETPRSGAIVERLLKGAKVKVLGHDGNWFNVQYGTFRGWVYREAIGL
jgi:hypothetical protein